MKSTTIILASLLGAPSLPCASAQELRDIVPGVTIDSLDVNHYGRNLTVEMSVDLSGLDVSPNRAVLLTPRLVNGADSVDLPSVGIYGRRRYYYHQRNGGAITGASERSFPASGKPSRLSYSAPVPYAEWMDGATLRLHRSDWGCCRAILSERGGDLGLHREAFFPPLVFVQPEAEVKSRSLSGSAYIDFPVDQTVIYPGYRRNTEELGKIQATIDSVRGDGDVSITSVWLKGYASPESPYQHNTELAVGRTAALKEHIGRLYSFPDGIITTEHEPEDWEGLRRYVENSNLEHRSGILSLIDSSMDPDAKEARIRRLYPSDYRFLLQNCYPALRHTDYRIDYDVRRFSSVEEIRRVMAEQPQKLGLDELYLLAGEYEPGTEEFTEVFETAVRMFPSDEVANLNAANAAMRRGDNAAAARYLEKAGGSAEAAYARGALAVRQRDYDTARRHLQEAEAMGLEQAARTLGELDGGRR